MGLRSDYNNGWIILAILKPFATLTKYLIVSKVLGAHNYS